MAVSGRTSVRMSILNQLSEDLKIIFLTETKCKIRFIYVRFDCKKKCYYRALLLGAIVLIGMKYEL